PQHQQCAAQAANEQEDHHAGNQRSTEEEQEDLFHAVDQIADQLGETDDMDLCPAVPGELLAYLGFQDLGQPGIVHGLAGMRVLLHQRYHVHDRALVVAHQAAENAGDADIALERPGIQVTRHHRTTAEAFLGHLGPAYRGHPDGLHPGTVHPGHQEQGVVDLLGNGQKLGVIDIPCRVFHHYPDHVTQTTY